MANRHGRHIPVGLELYSVRNDLKKDRSGTVRRVARMGYKGVEFFAPYYSWTTDDAKKVKAELDELHIWRHSTHNDLTSFKPEGIGKAIELNNILGTQYIVLASPGRVTTLDGWKQVAETLNQANETMARHGLHAGYHNHNTEWIPINGTKPMEVLASNTDKSIMLQLDVGTCVAAGSDPVAWVRSNPGRIRSMHLKDWSPQGGYHVLFGQGVVPWKKLFAAAESVGGAEYYLIEQEGSAYSEMETARLCLENYRKLRAGEALGVPVKAPIMPRAQR
ncbi:MAG: sugar phosphate isomerase/epimerase [Acidobacteriota bacterium]|nr:sugar phosphate isomerase/epimerase [Acidobacteriota bacterium]